jgi:hypothetical protein
MGRPAKRKKSTMTAGSMAGLRDASTVRAHNFQKVTGLINEKGPGSDRPPYVHRINMDNSEHRLLLDYASAWVSVMYGDLMFPGYGTPSKLEDFAQIAREISKGNKEKESVRKMFDRISRQMHRTAQQVTDMLHFESTMDEMKVVLYDMVLKMSMDNNLQLSGMLPPV